MKRQYKHTPNYIMKKQVEYLAECLAGSMDSRVRDSLVYGNGEYLVNPTKWFLFKLSIKNKIQSIRISLAEWIGGEHLHDNCGDY